MAKQNIQPDFVVDDLWAASQTILNSAPQTNKSLEEARWQRNIQKIFLDSARTKEAMIDVCTPSILQAASIIAKSHLNGGKLMLCGNGGSAADSQHIAGEFIGGLNSDRDREPLSAIALNTNTSNLTAIGNDFGFDQIFARQIKALGKTGDVLIGISTSGKSQNIIQAVIIAKELGIKTIGLMGQTGILKEIVEVAITVPSNNIQRIQEGHITIGHIICEIVEDLVNQKKLT
jgi:D-sedoheptulose 7-phosphate isomerase